MHQGPDSRDGYRAVGLRKVWNGVLLRNCAAGVKLPGSEWWTLPIFPAMLCRGIDMGWVEP